MIRNPKAYARAVERNRARKRTFPEEAEKGRQDHFRAVQLSKEAAEKLGKMAQESAELRAKQGRRERDIEEKREAFLEDQERERLCREMNTVQKSTKV